MGVRQQDSNFLKYVNERDSNNDIKCTASEVFFNQTTKYLQLKW
jgi:hypothetical protein